MNMMWWRKNRSFNLLFPSLPLFSSTHVTKKGKKGYDTVSWLNKNNINPFFFQGLFNILSIGQSVRSANWMTTAGLAIDRNLWLML